MPGFRILSLTIEGFKGFTVPKEIDLKERHVFLLGKNGNGKSSIIEAIRWGLFGSINRPNEVVTNIGYTGKCRVTLMFRRDNILWNFDRTLIRGVGGDTDAILTDEEGKIHSIREVIPRLDSTNTGEGMHIILSSQSAPLRRQPADLRPFERTVLRHLDLLRPQSLRTHLLNSLNGQRSSEEDFGQEIQKSKEGLDDRVHDQNQQRRGILQAPPWGNTPPPTIRQSEEKARQLIQEITGSALDKSLYGASLDALIEEAEGCLKERREEEIGALQTRSSAIATRIERLSEYTRCVTKVKSYTGVLESLQEEFESTLRGVSLSDLRKTVCATQKALSIATIRSRIVKNAVQLLTHDQADMLTCPVCAMNHNRGGLEALLEQRERELPTDEVTRQLDELENQLKQAEDLELKVRQRRIVIDNLRQEADTAYKAISAGDKENLTDSLDHLRHIIERLEKEDAGIHDQITGSQSKLNEVDTRISRLRDEYRYHRVEKGLLHLESMRREFGRISECYQSLVSFGESVRKIWQAVDGSFTECLERRLPSVSGRLSQAFSDLTNHPRFDLLGFANDRLPSLEIRVLSSQDPQRLPHLPDVLNGQAESALELVPYFTFGQVDDATTEVHLMMLDDPTRSYDDDHIGMLVKHLAELGNHVQLIVASQETERFRALLPQHFKNDSYIIVQPTNWSYENGPELSIDLV